MTLTCDPSDAHPTRHPAGHRAGNKGIRLRAASIADRAECPKRTLASLGPVVTRVACYATGKHGNPPQRRDEHDGARTAPSARCERGDRKVALATCAKLAPPVAVNTRG